MMTRHWTRLVAFVTLVAFGQTACYNTYVISKDELEKLESGVETKEVVDVSSKQGDKIAVSTSNAINVVSNEGEEFRVTPFNFMMSKQQLVSPEYDLLVSRDQIKGAEVRQFSTWKTVGTIVGVSAATIGMFVGISILAPESESFQE